MRDFEPERPGPLPAPSVPAHVEAALRQCIHCGLCLEACPTYRETRVEADGPRGRLFLMRGIAAGRIDPSGDAGEHLAQCLGCRACETACPSGVGYGDAIEWGRGVVQRARPSTFRSALFRLLGLRVLLPRPWLLDLVARLTRAAQRAGLVTLAERWGIARWLLGEASGTAMALLPPAPTDAVERLAELTPADGPPRARVVVLTGCVTERLLPGLNRATVRVLARNGCEVVVPRGQGCCGALALHGGEPELGRRLALELADSLPEDADFVVSNAAGCGSALRELSAGFEPGTAEHERAERFSRKVRDVTELLDALGLVPPEGHLSGRAAYDEPCHLQHAQGVSAAPKRILGALRGVEWVTLEDADTCCGSAGIYNLTQPEMSARVLARKIDEVERSGAELIVTGNPGCLLQIAAGARERGLTIETLHPVELLDRAYAAASRPQD